MTFEHFILFQTLLGHLTSKYLYMYNMYFTYNYMYM